VNGAKNTDVPDPQETGVGQSSAERPPLEVREDELERIGSIAPGGRMSVAQMARTVLLVHGKRGFDAAATELLIGLLDKTEADATEFKEEARAWRTRAITAETENARVGGMEKPWHEKVRLVVGGGLATLGFSGAAYTFQLQNGVAVVVGVVAGLLVLLGVALIAVPWIPALVSAVTRKIR
jgi:hypothetical protein